MEEGSPLANIEAPICIVGGGEESVLDVNVSLTNLYMSGYSLKGDNN